MNDLLIRWNSVGTHAEVSRATENDPPTPGTHRLRPDESYYGIPYERWAAHVESTVDVLHLQFEIARDNAPRPPLAITARLASEGWEVEDALLQSVPADAEYGFSTGARLVPCSRAQLTAQCVAAPETPRVWGPGTGGLVAPERVAFLVDALRAHRRRSAERSTQIAGIVLAVSGVLAWQAPVRSGWAVLAALAAAWFTVTLVEYRQARSTGAAAYAAAREEFRHDVWIQSQRSVHTVTLLTLLILVAFAQSFGLERSIAAAGLVKEAVRGGEVWRLLTGPLLHGGVLHLAMNGLALWSLGPLVEAHSRRGFLPWLFLVSALAGGVFSLLLLPDGTSVGASGGILGLAGYLLVLAFRRRRALPSGFVQRLGIGILATAVFGIVGHAWVDNATHLGGMLAGMTMAFLPGPGEEPVASTPRGPRRTAMHGAVAVLVIGALVAVAAIYLSLGGPLPATTRG